MKRKTLVLMVSICVLLLAFQINLALSFEYEDPGITDTEIKIGVFAPLSGKFVSYGIDPMRGVKMSYEMINAQGGIYGRKIVLVEEDDKCSGTSLVAAVKKLVTVDNVFLLNGGTCSSAFMAAMDYIQREQIPTVGMTASMDGLLYPPKKYIFGGIGGTVHGFGGSIVDFSIKYLKAKRIAYVMHDDAYGSWGHEAFAWQLKAEHNLEPVALEKINRDITDVTAVMLKIKKANPDVVIFMTYDRPGALLIRAAHTLGMQMPLILGATGAVNPVATAEAVGVKEAFKNFYYQSAIRDEHTAGPELEWARKLYTKRYPELAKKPDLPAPNGFVGIGSANLVATALQIAGPHPTREKFIQALEGLRYYDSGVSAGTWHFSPEDHAATEQATIYRFDGEKREKIPGSFEGHWKYGAK
jgi:branched-chain amino acid transport system substrate-binding protein